MKKLLFLFLVFGLSATFFLSCRSDNDTIVKNSLDSINVYTPLISDDSLYFLNTFRGIQVAQTRDRFSTKNSEVYIDMDITILDQNPKITSNLLAFAIFNLSDWGFLNTSDSLISEKFNINAYKYKSTQEDLNKFSDIISSKFYEQLPEILEFDCGYNIDIDIYPVFLNENFVTYYKYAYYYTGGVHGNYSEFLQTYDIKTGETINLEDIILPDGFDKLREVVVKHMAASYPIYDGIMTIDQYLDSLNMWKGETNLGVVLGMISADDIEKISLKNYPINDPGINDIGLVISYEKYFLTPGADGCPKIVISYDEIRDCLKEPFKSYKSILPTENKTTELVEDIDRGWYYSKEDIDSIRKTIGLTDYGKPYPSDINEFYKFRGGKLEKKYKVQNIHGEWIIYGHKYDPRERLTLLPNGQFIEIEQNVLAEDSLGKMRYFHRGRKDGFYTYDETKNLITLYNYENIRNIPLEGFLKYDNPENRQYIVASIDNDTIWLADEVGDLWQGYRPNVELEWINDTNVKLSKMINYGCKNYRY